MKKISLIFVISILAWTGMRAQDIDTLPCGQRQHNYSYPRWYDTADWFLHPDKYHYITQYSVHFNPRNSGRSNVVEANQCYTATPIRVRGLWAMVSQDVTGFPERNNSANHVILDSTRLPEYLYLYVRDSVIKPDTVSYDSSRWLKPVAHARWDTNQPRMLCMEKTADGRYGHSYCHLFEAYFDSVYTIQGEYWIGGTCNSNYQNVHNPYEHPHFMTIYLGWATSRDDMNNPHAHFVWGYNGPEEAFFAPHPSMIANWFGPYGIITDGQRFLQLSSADTAQGEALYSAFYPDSSYQTITAVPVHGFLFSHWNDGNTDNPRTVFLTQDTAFTAYFRPAPLHSVTVRSSDDALGYTTGDSIYYEGDQAVIKAVPLADSVLFLRWNDSVTDNPRTILVMQDTAFTAYFGSPQGIIAPDAKAPLFTLTPNPAHHSVTVTVNPQFPILNAQLSISDAAGRELYSSRVSTLNFQLSISQYPAGTYFVTLRTPDTSSTQRLVIE